jgi:ornithine cyclodeaminase/alanine dehydrogenase-like protein (mu-crystallin family)
MGIKYRDWINNYLTIGSEMLYITKDECDRLSPSGQELLAYAEKSLLAHGRKELDMPPKIGLHHKEKCFMSAMPVYMENDLGCGCKWGAGFPRNPEEFGLPPMSFLLIYNDAESGWPLAIMDGIVITAKRTPAVSAVAAKYLANPTASTFGVIGCGVQGRGHVTLMPYVLNLKEIYIYDICDDPMDELIESLQPEIEAKIIKASSYEEVVKNSEVLATTTSVLDKPDCRIKDEWITRGQTLLLVDLHSLFEDKTMKNADKYFVDDIRQHLIQEKYGKYPYGLPKIYGELGEVVAGFKKGREKTNEIVVSNNVGLAAADMPLARIIFDRSLKEGTSQRLKF